jgi:hypothetical protein
LASSWRQARSTRDQKDQVRVDMLTSNTLLAAIEEALEPGDELKLAELSHAAQTQL